MVPERDESVEKLYRQRTLNKRERKKEKQKRRQEREMVGGCIKEETCQKVDINYSVCKVFLSGFHVAFQNR